MSTRMRLLSAAAVAAVLLCAEGVGVLYHHEVSGQWTLNVFSSPFPDRVHFEGRAYDRGSQMELPADAVERGTTDGGSTIYLDPGNVGTPTGLYLRNGSTTWEYALVGGP